MKGRAIIFGVVGASLLVLLITAASKTSLRCHRYFYYPNSRGLYYDPKNDNPKYAKAFASVREAAAKLCGPPSLGYGPCMDAEIQRLLKKEHGIEWRTPEELNPCAIFD